MSQFYNQTRKLFHCIIRVSKEDASFVYFTLESNENLAFYSTHDHEIGQNYRDIDIKCAIEYSVAIQNLLQQLSTQFEMSTLKMEIIEDSI